jgi:hypothetical protein
MSKSIEALHFGSCSHLFINCRADRHPNEAPLPAEAEAPQFERQASAHGPCGAATPMARVSSAMRDLSDMSDYRWHMVSGEPIPRSHAGCRFGVRAASGRVVCRMTAAGARTCATRVRWSGHGPGPCNHRFMPNRRSFARHSHAFSQDGTLIA